MMATLSSLFDWLSTALILLLMVPLGMTCARMLNGPGYADRFVALDMLTGRPWPSPRWSPPSRCGANSWTWPSASR
ncbi:hypothetical protein [Teichococcus aestuarii]|uniref:hypothetical protein n=1 Tax=Teichococcus aestuarii TaxID=568898 RepID=UPI00361B727C